MRITDLSVTNYRCFEEARIPFEPGVTVLHGPNGAGKTTILEAILFGLYGARALADATLGDVITQGTDETAVTLAFRHEGSGYELHREVRQSGERPSTAVCELRGPDGTHIEGARPVREHIIELLRLDAEAFVNSAYVRQGEINKLLHASPAERQSMIDELLQLGRLETYQDRADEARLAVRTLREQREERLAEIDAQLESLREAEPYETLNELETDRDRLTEELSDLQDRRETLTERRRELDDRLESLEETRDALDETRQRREEVRERLEAIAEERRELRTELSEARDQRDEAADRVASLREELDVSEGDLATEREAIEDEIDATEAAHEEAREAVETAQSARAEATERKHAIEDSLEERREEVAEVTEAIEADREVLEERREQRDELQESREALMESLPTDEELSALRERLEAEAEEVDDELAEARADLAAIRDHIEQAETLAEQEKCPTCGQPVDEAPHLDALEADREEQTTLENRIDELEARQETIEDHLDTVEEIEALENEIASIADLIEEREATLAERTERKSELAERIDELESDRAEAIEAQEAAEADLEAARERVGETNERIQSLRDRTADLDELEAAIDAHEAATDANERLSERLDELAELEAEREDRLAEIDDRIDELEADLESADADELAAEREDVLEELESVTDRIEAVTEERDRLTEHIGSVRTDIEQLEDLEDRREAFTDEHEALSSVESEAAELGELYADVKASLRERNVTTLERLLNDTFELLYRNEAYDRIDLSPEYELAVEQKDGTELEPMQLSGGERAIFNLSLRCGIYRLLAEGVEGTAPLPPLMLDEPTVFLDEGHVGQLVRLFEALREMGVEQTLVVSHHEALLDAAEHRVAVEKDPTTNRSTVEVLEAAPRP